MYFADIHVDNVFIAPFSPWVSPQPVRLDLLQSRKQKQTKTYLPWQQRWFKVESRKKTDFFLSLIETRLLFISLQASSLYK